MVQYTVGHINLHLPPCFSFAIWSDIKLPQQSNLQFANDIPAIFRIAYISNVCMYIKKEVNYSDSALSHMNKSSKNIELQWVLLKNKCKDIVIANVYRPPSGNIEYFCEHLNNSLNSIDTVKKEVFILGDFNIDMMKKSDKGSKDLIRIMNGFGLKQLINGTTRYGSSDSCIDLIFTNSDTIEDSGILDLNFSDHQGVFAVRKKKKQEKTKIEFKGRSYKYYNKDIFQEMLRKVDWTILFSIDNPNNCWEYMFNNIINCLEVLCPEKMFKSFEYREKWMNKDLMELIIDKDKALKKANKSGEPDDWIIAKKIRNSTGRLIEMAKKINLKMNI